MIGAAMLLSRLKTVASLLAASVLLAAVPAGAAEFPLMPDESVVGNLREYVTKQGDNLIDLSRRFDIGYTEMLAANPGVDPWIPGAGKRLTIPSLFILPNAPRRGIVINLAERRLYYFPPGQNEVVTYPIGIGVVGRNTPMGTTRVVRKERNPVWIPPPSIRAERPDLPTMIGPGPDNPLGAFALRLGWKNYLIHGTNKPPGVGRNVSHGCIHLYPEDIEALFNMVDVGTPVRVVSQPSAAAWIGIGLYVETHPNKQQADQIDMAQTVTRTPVHGLHEVVQAAAGQYADAVDWNAVDRAGLERTGLPVEVARRPPQGMVSSQSPAAGNAPGSTYAADDEAAGRWSDPTAGASSRNADEGTLRPPPAESASRRRAIADEPVPSRGDAADDAWSDDGGWNGTGANAPDSAAAWSSAPPPQDDGDASAADNDPDRPAWDYGPR